MNIQALIPQLIGWGIQWISQQRDLHRPGGRELTQAEKRAFDLFFDRTILDSVRLKWVQLLQNPPFYLQIQQMGLPLIPLIPFADMDGITFADTILLAQKGVRHEPPPLPLLFHEMVHVVQYEVLGIETFVTRYVHGWFGQGQVYVQIPLENHAYQLQARYQSATSIGFSVRAEVQQRSHAY